MSDEFLNSPIVRLQMKMRELQEEISAIRAEGTAHGGAVKVVFAGGSGFQSVKIDRALVSSDRRAELEAALLEAAGKAVEEVLIQVQAKTIAMHKNLGLP